MSHLQLQNASAFYGSFKALDQISFQAAQGQLVGLVGPSGCGKTTTFKVISGLVPLTEGEIRLGTASLNNVPPHLRDLGVVFQSYALFPHMTAAQNVAYGLVMRRRPKDEIKLRVKSVLSLVQLDGLGDRYPRQLSGGQQQRVALARALVIEPALLLLDEPMSNLDANLRLAMRAEIRQLQKKLGITTILVTHDLDEAFATSDHIVVLNKGEIQQQGMPEHVYRHPVNAFVAQFVGHKNLLSGPQFLEHIAPHMPDHGLRISADSWIVIDQHQIKVRIDGSETGIGFVSGVVRQHLPGVSQSMLTVELPGGLILVVESDNYALSGPIREGDAVKLGWDQSAVIVIGEPVDEARQRLRGAR